MIELCRSIEKSIEIFFESLYPPLTTRTTCLCRFAKHTSIDHLGIITSQYSAYFIWHILLVNLYHEYDYRNCKK